MSELLKLEHGQPLPRDLAERYRSWKDIDHVRNRAMHRTLAEQGQSPHSMVVSCCDSRVHATMLFGASLGEFFVHRNIAALVPPYDPDGGQMGTSAAVEYAVRALGVSRIMVLGHSNCGGVQGCIDMCRNHDNAPVSGYQFVGRWLEILRPAYENVASIPDSAVQRTALEREAVVLSLANLMSFPFVSDEVGRRKLTLHGLWHDIGEGSLWEYDSRVGCFAEI